LRHRTDGLPLRLQGLDGLGGGLPLVGLAQLLGADAEGLLLAEVLLLLLAQPGIVLLAPAEELVERLAETLPDRVAVLARHRPGRLPLGLQGLQGLGRGLPLRRRRQLLGAGAESLLLAEVLLLLLAQLGQVLLAPLEEAVRRRPEAVPQLLRELLGHRADGLPLGLQALDRLGRGLPLGGVLELLGPPDEGFLALEVLRELLLPLGSLGLGLDLSGGLGAVLELGRMVAG